MLNKFKKRARKLIFEMPVHWPSLDQEIGEDRKYLTGNVLNAGSGANRPIESFINGKIINQDIFEHQNIDIVSPLHKIPVESGYFDSILCNAVLEHVSNPVEVMNEFSRVIKKDGYIYLAVPFMQPEHKSPTDYQRYTLDGLRKLVEDAGFVIVKADSSSYNVYQTIGWILYEWLKKVNGLPVILFKVILFPIIKRKSRTSKWVVHEIASCYRVVARKV